MTFAKTQIRSQELHWFSHISSDLSPSAPVFNYPGMTRCCWNLHGGFSWFSGARVQSNPGLVQGQAMTAQTKRAQKCGAAPTSLKSVRSVAHLWTGWNFLNLSNALFEDCGIWANGKFNCVGVGISNQESFKEFTQCP